MDTKKLPVPIQHQIKIAKKTLTYSDIGARIMGGISKAEAREILKRYGIKFTEDDWQAHKKG